MTFCVFLLNFCFLPYNDINNEWSKNMNHFNEIKNELIKLNLDAILLTSASNCFYATSFYCLEGDCKCLITKDSGNFYFTDSRYTEAANKNILDAIVLENNKLDDFKFRKIGIEENKLTVSEFKNLQKKFSGCDFVNISDVLTDLRSVKDKDEQILMQEAQDITDKAFTKILNDIRVGITEKEISAKLQYYMLDLGAERMSFDPIVASGPNGSMPHAVPTDRQIQDGDFVTLDFGCVYNGYCSDMTRTVAIGNITEEQKKVYDIVLKAQKETIKKARAGLTGTKIDAIARNIITDNGYGSFFGHALGHGVGIDIHENPIASPKYNKVLPVNSYISCEPGIYIPGKFGVRIEDVIRLTENGNIDITKSKKELLIL